MSDSSPPARKDEHLPDFAERLSPGSAPLANALPRVEGDPRFQAEMPREVRASAEKRLAALEKVFAELQAEAQLIVGGARRDLALHAVPQNGTRLRGQSYHLYARPDGRQFFSLLDPVEYGQIDTAVRYEGHYRLEYDGSWRRLDADDAADRVRHAPPVRGPHFELTDERK